MNRDVKQLNIDYCKKGFSLVEVLLAIVILAIVAAPIANAFFSSMKTNLKSRDIMGATDFTESIIEEFEKQTFDEIGAKLERNTYGEDDVVERIASVGITKDNSTSNKFSDLVDYEDFKTRCNELKIEENVMDIYYGFFLDEESRAHYCYFIPNVSYSETNEGNFRYKYDVLLEFVDNGIDTKADEYCVYDINVNTYKSGSYNKRFVDHRCKMKGSVFNKY